MLTFINWQVTQGPITEKYHCWQVLAMWTQRRSHIGICTQHQCLGFDKPCVWNTGPPWTPALFYAGKQCMFCSKRMDAFGVSHTWYRQRNVCVFTLNSQHAWEILNELPILIRFIIIHWFRHSPLHCCSNDCLQHKTYKYKKCVPCCWHENKKCVSISFFIVN